MQVVWASAIHLYAPLPFLNSKFSFTENLRLHGFVNCGGIGQNVAECCKLFVKLFVILEIHLQILTLV